MRLLANAIAVLAAVSLMTAPAMALDPAGFTSTGNAAADMAYSLGRNRQLGQAAATKIAYYVGGEAAGTSLMSRILKRGPLKRFFQVAAVAGIGYFVYQLATGQWAATGSEPEKAQLDDQFVAVDFSNTQRFLGKDEYLAFRRDLPPGAYTVYVEIGGSAQVLLTFSRWVTDAQWRDPARAIQLVVDGAPQGSYFFENGSFETATGSRDSTQAETIVSDGITWRRGYASVNFAYAQQKPDVLFKWMNDVPSSQQEASQKATSPGDIPDVGTIINERIAEDLNDLVKRALEKHQDDEDLKQLAATPFTPAEIAATATADAPERNVGTRSAPDPEPLPQPQPETQPTPTTGTPKDTGSTVGTGGITIDDVTPKLPGVSVTPFTYTPGQCPTFQFGADQMPSAARAGLVAFGYPDHLALERHCVVLNDIAPWFRPFLLVLIFVVGFGIFRGRGG